MKHLERNIVNISHKHPSRLIKMTSLEEAKFSRLWTAKFMHFGTQELLGAFHSDSSLWMSRLKGLGSPIFFPWPRYRNPAASVPEVFHVQDAWLDYLLAGFSKI